MRWPSEPRSRAEFASIAPRLERAHRERRDELAAESRARVRAAGRVLKAQRLVAHRELQLLRAGDRQGGRRARERYVRHRANLLEDARKELANAERRARDLGLELAE